MRRKVWLSNDASGRFEETVVKSRDIGDDDVCISIMYCGICHSDVHHARNEWSSTIYPIVPGHEIIGKVVDTGKNVTRFKKDMYVAVGTFVGGCKQNGTASSCCKHCVAGKEQFCKDIVWTYDSKDDREPDKIAFGGYSDSIVVNESFVFSIPDSIPAESLHRLAPILCAGVTVYAPMIRTDIKGKRVLVAGLGGLGHLAVKYAVYLGATFVDCLSRSTEKEEYARSLGCRRLVTSESPALSTEYDIIIDTISADHDICSMLNMLDVHGTLIMLGLPPGKPPLDVMQLVCKDLQVIGGCVGSLQETQEALDTGILADTTLIRTIAELNDVHDQLHLGKSNINGRYVLDMEKMEKMEKMDKYI